MNIFVTHNLNTTLGRFSDNTDYGLTVPTFSTVTTDSLDIHYKLKADNLVNDDLSIINVRTFKNYT